MGGLRIIGNHSLECSGGVRLARYKDIQSGKYDAIHMVGPSGQKSYTESVLKVLSSAQLVQVTPPKYYDEYPRYQKKQQTNRNRVNAQNRKSSSNLSNGQSSRHHQDNQYTVPTYNRYAQLSDYFPGNY